MPRPGSGQTTVSIATKLLSEINDKRKSLLQEQEARMQKDKTAINKFGDKLNSQGKFIGFLFEQFLNSHNLNVVLKRLNIKGGTFDVEWPSNALDTLCEQMDWYRSTEWIRDKNHAEVIGSYQQPATLMNRIRTCEHFKFEKILIIPKAIWESKETWSWVLKVLRIRLDNSDKDISIKVAREEAVRDAQIDSKNFDMGIYKIGDAKPFIGFLDREFTPPKFQWRLEDKSCNEAENAFSRLKKVTETKESLGKMIGKYFETSLE